MESREIGELRGDALAHAVHTPCGQGRIDVLAEHLALREVRKRDGFPDHLHGALVEVHAGAREDGPLRAGGHALFELAVQVGQEPRGRPALSAAPNRGVFGFFLAHSDEDQGLVGEANVGHLVACASPAAGVRPRVAPPGTLPTGDGGQRLAPQALEPREGHRNIRGAAPAKVVRKLPACAFHSEGLYWPMRAYSNALRSSAYRVLIFLVGGLDRRVYGPGAGST